MRHLMHVGLLSAMALAVFAVEGEAGAGGSAKALDPPVGDQVPTSQLPAAGSEKSGQQLFAEEVSQALEAVHTQLDGIRGELKDQAANLTNVNSRAEDSARKLGTLDLEAFKEQLARSDQSAAALDKRLGAVEDGLKRIADVADDLRSADVEPRLKKLEDAMAKVGTDRTEGTTLNSVLQGEDTALRDMASKLDHLWRQNGNT